MECPNCHLKLENNVSVCPKCGWEEKTEVPVNDFSIDFMFDNKEPLKEIEEEKKEVIKEPITSYHLDVVTKESGERLTLEDIEKEEAIRREREKVNELNVKEEEKDEYDYDEYELLSCYIGKNSEKITDEGFSWAAFFFGIFYLVYRKCWSYFFLVVFGSGILSAITVVLPLPSFIIMGLHLIIMIIIGILFKKLYVDYCLKKIRKIMDKNQDKTFTEVSYICAQKGGASIGTAISIMILFVIVLLLIFKIFFEQTIPDLFHNLDAPQEQIKTDIDEINQKNQDMNNYITAVEEGCLKMKTITPGKTCGATYTKLTKTSAMNEDGSSILSIEGEVAEPYPGESNYFIMDNTGKVTEAYIKFDNYYVSYCNGNLDTTNTGFTKCIAQ